MCAESIICVQLRKNKKSSQGIETRSRGIGAKIGEKVHAGKCGLEIKVEEDGELHEL